ncbi:hypothetical protein N9B50_01395 [bacterium]|nr:hypothetical protein [bacterium]
MDIGDLGDWTNLAGNVSSARNAQETAELRQMLEEQQRREAALPDCPYCGNKLAKVGVKLCGQCREKIAWVEHLPCEPNQASINATKVRLGTEKANIAAARQAEKLAADRQRLEADRQRKKETARLHAKEIRNQEEWELVFVYVLPWTFICGLAFVLGVVLSNFDEGQGEIFSLILLTLILGTPLFWLTSSLWMTFKQQTDKNFASRMLGRAPTESRLERLLVVMRGYAPFEKKTTTEQEFDAPKHDPYYWIKRKGELHGPFQKASLVEAAKYKKLLKGDLLGNNRKGPWQLLSKEHLQAMHSGKDVEISN